MSFLKGDSLEGLVDGPVPAEEGAGSEEDEPENGEAKIHTVGSISGEVSQTRQQVEEQSHTVDCRNSEERPESMKIILLLISAPSSFI